VSQPSANEVIRNIIGEIPAYVLGYLEISDAIQEEWKENSRSYLQLYSDKLAKAIREVIEREVIGEDETMPHPIVTDEQVVALNLFKRHQRHELKRLLGIDDDQEADEAR
jgi:hypothetical protein